MFAHGSTAISHGADISEVPGCICYDRWVLSEGHKKYLKDWCPLNSQPTFLFLNLFKPKDLWPYYQKHANQIILNRNNSLKLSLRNIPGLPSNFVDCESFLESNCPHIFALCETNLDDSVDFDNFSVRGYLALIRKDSSTHMYGLKFTWKMDIRLHGAYLSENSADSYLCFDWLYVAQCLTSFSSINHLLPLCARFLILFHLT